jgi:hypothetical protein
MTATSRPDPLLVVLEEQAYGRTQQFHLREEFCLVASLYINRHDNYDTDQVRAAGPKVTELIRRLMTVKGIEQVHFTPYYFTVTRAETYTWTELEGQILDALQAAFNAARLDARRKIGSEHQPVPLLGQEFEECFNAAAYARD